MEFVMEIRNVEERHIAAVRTRTSVEKLSEVLGSCYGEVMQCITSQDAQPAGPPFAIYYNMDMNDLDVEIGFPVVSEIQGSGRVKAGKIPGGKAAVGTHIGPYDAIGDTYAKLSSFLEEKGLEPDLFCYEFYLNDPAETKPEELKTEIYFPLK
jgi:effector-binding domain-containing protein